MTRLRPLIIAVALAGLAPPLGAQDPSAPAPQQSWTRGAVHYGKWATAAVALGLTVLAAKEHRHANDNWQQLRALCQTDNSACQLRPDGQYANANAELLYQQTLYYDRRARRRLIVGQVSLLATAALFILDLRNQRGSPPNIPFTELEVMAEPAGSGARVGVRFGF
ncbi:MAG TPA: hypothetical protein VH833_09660 [Gemmatimonadales bacterium]